MPKQNNAPFAVYKSCTLQLPDGVTLNLAQNGKLPPSAELELTLENTHQICDIKPITCGEVKRLDYMKDWMQEMAGVVVVSKPLVTLSLKDKVGVKCCWGWRRLFSILARTVWSISIDAKFVGFH